jgi:hypothetical protein
MDGRYAEVVYRGYIDSAKATPDVRLSGDVTDQE